jgi:CRP-like cAMP-binding protein
MKQLLAAVLGWTKDAEQQRRVALLAQTALFAGLRKRLLRRLAILLLEKTYQPGEEIFREGEPGRALFVVASGRVEAIRTTPDGEERLAVFEEKSVFGELALIDDLPRAATARTLAPTTVLLLYRSHFDELMEGDPRVALALCRNLLRTLARYVRTRQLAPGSPAGSNPKVEPAGPAPAGER